MRVNNYLHYVAIHSRMFVRRIIARDRKIKQFNESSLLYFTHISHEEDPEWKSLLNRQC